jgi:hypothetical protein
MRYYGNYNPIQLKSYDNIMINIRDELIAVFPTLGSNPLYSAGI